MECKATPWFLPCSRLKTGLNIYIYIYKEFLIHYLVANTGRGKIKIKCVWMLTRKPEFFCSKYITC